MVPRWRGELKHQNVGRMVSLAFLDREPCVMQLMWVVHAGAHAHA